jgi:hypothetical protein
VGKPIAATSLLLALAACAAGAPSAAVMKDWQDLKYLDKSHHGTDLTAEERRRITMWLDCNSNELGDYRDEKAQRAGQVVWPLFDVNRDNVLGVETLRPARAAR